MKINLLVELNNYIAKLGPAHGTRGGQLLILAAHEIAVMRDSNRRLHDRAQLAECALPEWKEICTATAGQSTGRFFPALVRLALTQAEDRNEELERRCKKQTEEQRHLNDLYFRAFELAGGKPDDNADDLPVLIEHLVSKLGRRAAAIVLLRMALVRACCPTCICGAHTGGPGLFAHSADCEAEPLLSDSPANRELTSMEFRVGREIASTIGTIPGTSNLGPGLEPIEKPLPKLPLRYRVVDGEEKDVAFIEDADGRMLFVLRFEGSRGRSTLDDLCAEAERRIVQLTRSIEAKAAR